MPKPNKKTKKYLSALNILSSRDYVDFDPLEIEKYFDTVSVLPADIYHLLAKDGYRWDGKRWGYTKRPKWLLETRSHFSSHFCLED
jgi:hypothetical protein